MERLVLNNLKTAVEENAFLTQVAEQRGTDLWIQKEKGPNL
jgi:hypothetical protein